MQQIITAEPRDAAIRQLHAERERLTSHIQRLQEQADSASGGVRMYRNQRVGHFREREQDLDIRLSRIEEAELDASVFGNQAENLAQDMRETADLAATTLRQLSSF